MNAHLPLFVYGTLLTGQPAFDLIAAASIRAASARVAGLSMYNVGRYPMATPGAGELIGELHWLYTQLYAQLLVDLKAYEGPEYTRRRCLARLVEDNTSVEAWVFVGEQAYGARFPAIAHGDWRRWLREN
jgi:gamma-glutamylcyclotransferase (GGCT)/AIG2-like uncharacterized protein YtfP